MDWWAQIAAAEARGWLAALAHRDRCVRPDCHCRESPEEPPPPPAPPPEEPTLNESVKKRG